MKRFPSVVPMPVRPGTSAELHTLSSEMQGFSRRLIKEAEEHDQQGNRQMAEKARARLSELTNVMSPVSLAIEHGESKIGVQYIEDARRRFRALTEDQNYLGRHADEPTGPFRTVSNPDIF